MRLRVLVPAVPAPVGAPLLRAFALIAPICIGAVAASLPAHGQVVIRERVEIEEPESSASAVGGEPFELLFSMSYAQTSCGWDCFEPLDGDAAFVVSGTRPDGTAFSETVNVSSHTLLDRSYEGNGNYCRYWGSGGRKSRGVMVYEEAEPGPVSLGYAVGPVTVTSTFGDPSWDTTFDRDDFVGVSMRRARAASYARGHSYPYCYTGTRTFGEIFIHRVGETELKLDPRTDTWLLRYNEHGIDLRLRVVDAELGGEVRQDSATATFSLPQEGDQPFGRFVYDGVPGTLAPGATLSGVPYADARSEQVRLDADAEPPGWDDVNLTVEASIQGGDEPWDPVQANYRLLMVWAEAEVDPGLVYPGGEATIRGDLVDALGEVDLDPETPFNLWFYGADDEALSGVIVNTETGEESDDMLTVTYAQLQSGAVRYRHGIQSGGGAARAGAQHGSRIPRSGWVAGNGRQVYRRAGPNPPRALGRPPRRYAQLPFEDFEGSQVDGPVVPRAVPTDGGRVPFGEAEEHTRGVRERTPRGAGTPAARGVETDWVLVDIESFDWSIYGWVDIEVVPLRVDLAADSDNDGALDEDDEVAEYDDGRLGALLGYNDDDDDGDGVPDFEDPAVPGEDDLEELRLGVLPDSSGQSTTLVLRLEALEGGENVRVWEDAAKTTAVALPRELDYSDLPVTYWTEGVAWDDATTVLRLVLEDPAGGELEADTLRVYSGPTGVSLPAEAAAGESPTAVLTGLPPGAEVDFAVYRNGALVQTLQETVADLRATAGVDAWPSRQSPGDVYRVEAVADGGALTLESGPSVVVPGPAVTTTLAVTDDRLPSDGSALANVTLSGFDAYGNPVRDGTPVFWDLGDAGHLLHAADSTVGGTATAEVQAGWLGDLQQELQAHVDTATAATSLDNLPVDVVLQASTGTLEIGSGGQATVTATVTDLDGNPVPNGTPVTWFSSKGELQASAVVTGGVASATLSADAGNQTTGRAIISAAVGNNVGRAEVSFTPPTDCLHAEAQMPFSDVALPVLVGDEVFDPSSQGGGYVAVEQADGSFEDYPYWTAVEGVVRGDPGTVVSVTIPAEARPFLSLYSLDGATQSGPDGTIEVEVDLLGVARFLIGSTGAFTEQAHPDDAFYRTALDVAFVGDVPPGGGGRGSDCTTQTTLDVVVTTKGRWGRLLDGVGNFAWGALSGEGDDLAAISGDLVLGALPVVGVFSDGRDVIKEVARLWPGGESPNFVVAGFALFGLAAEIPLFKGGPDQVLGLAKNVLKRLSPGSPLTRGIWSFLKRAVADLDVDAVLDSGPVFTKLLDSPSFRQLAEETLVRSDDGFDALRTMMSRVGADEVEDVLTALSTEVSPGQLRRAMSLWGSGLDEATAIALRDAGKLEVISRAAAKGDWAARAARRYRDAVVALGPDHPALLKLDEFVEVPGSAKLLRRQSTPEASLVDAGVQFELDAARSLRGRGEDVVELGVRRPSRELDIVTDRHLVEVKGGNPSNIDREKMLGDLERTDLFAQQSGKTALVVFSSQYSPLDPRVADLLQRVGVAHEFIARGAFRIGAVGASYVRPELQSID